MRPLGQVAGDRIRGPGLRDPLVQHLVAVHEQADAVVSGDRELVGARCVDVDRLGPPGREVVRGHPGAGGAAAPVEVDCVVGPGEDGRAGQVPVREVLGGVGGASRHHRADSFVRELGLRVDRALEVLHAQLVGTARDHLVDAVRLVAESPLVNHRHVVDVDPDAVVADATEPIDAGGEGHGLRPPRHEPIRIDSAPRRAGAPVEVERVIVADEVGWTGRDAGRTGGARRVPVLRVVGGLGGWITDPLIAQSGYGTAAVLVVLHHDLVRAAVQRQGGAVGGRTLVDPLVDHADPVDVQPHPVVSGGRELVVAGSDTDRARPAGHEPVGGDDCAG